MGDKLNTAEFDSKGRCVRHPAIRLRKKKMFGGWKIIIGHCPECCLDEMRRVRDEIGAEQEEYDRRGSREGERRHRKERKKKRGDRDRHRGRDKDRSGGDREHRGKPHRSSGDSISDVGSEGHPRSMEGGGDRSGGGGGRRHPQQQGGGHPHSQAPHRDGESDATGSTAQNSSMAGDGSVVSEQYVPRYQNHHHGGREGYYQQQQQQLPVPVPQQHHHHNPHQHPPHSSLPPTQRTMVLSMAFTDPQTGQRGTYTGQVNSINHKPDGKGTVYYANGSIAEGSWVNGTLVESEGDDSGGGSGGHGQRIRADSFGRGEGYGGGGGYPPPPPATGRSRSNSRGHRADPPLSGGGGGQAPRPSPGGGGRHHIGYSSRGESAPPAGPDSNAPFTGNLDQLDRLGGRRRHHTPQGTSASVQSYNSRGSHGYGKAPSGSASVQEFSSAGGASTSVQQEYGRGSSYDRTPRGAGGIYGNSDFPKGDGGYQGQQEGVQSFHGRNPPGYR